MGEAILAINAGTSSVGMTVFDLQSPPRAIATAKVAGITAPPRTFKYSHGKNKNSREIEEKIETPQDAFKYLLKHFLNDSELDIVSNKDDFAYICHRVVHGGEFEHAAVITTDTFGYVEKLQELAPLYVKRNVSLPEHRAYESTQT